jgi:aryl-alcohol dehydrogenase-like predicted oxidoreductase
LYLENKSKRVQAMANRFVNEKTLEATKKYMSISKNYNISPVTLAVAYSKHFDFVASNIIWARKKEQLHDSFEAIGFKMSQEILDEIKTIQQEILYPMG